MTYEEYVKELTLEINSLLKKFRLKTDKEDLKQEAYILIWELFQQGRLDKENYKGYFYNSFKYKLLQILEEEHKQGLWIKNSIYKADFTLTDCYSFNTDWENFIDPYLINLREKRKEYSKKYYEQNKEHKKKQTRKNYYIKKYGLEYWEKIRIENEKKKIQNETQNEKLIINELGSFLYNNCFIYRYQKTIKHKRIIISFSIKEYEKLGILVKDLLKDYLTRNNFEMRFTEKEIELFLK